MVSLFLCLCLFKGSFPPISIYAKGNVPCIGFRIDAFRGTRLSSNPSSGFTNGCVIFLNSSVVQQPHCHPENNKRTSCMKFLSCSKVTQASTQCSVQWSESILCTSFAEPRSASLQPPSPSTPFSSKSKAPFPSPLSVGRLCNLLLTGKKKWQKGQWSLRLVVRGTGAPLCFLLGHSQEQNQPPCCWLLKQPPGDI